MPIVSFSADKPVVVPKITTIDNDAELILSGKSQFSHKILKLKIYNEKYPDDIYYAFIKSDEAGDYQLTKLDIDIKRLKDGLIVFEISTNEQENSKPVLNLSKKLDKGLLLKINERSADESVSDGYVNSYEVSNYVIEGETESNIKALTLSITDKNNTSLTYTLEDISLDDEAKFRLENIDLTNLLDGKLTIKAKGVDIAGNKAEVELSLVKDTDVAKVKLLKKIKNNNLSNVLNKKILVASGTSEPKASIYFEFTQDDVVVNKSVVANEKGEWELLGADLDVSVFQNKKVKVSIFQVDIAYNKSEAIFYANEKFKRPIFPIVPIPIDPEKYQLIYTITDNTDEVKDILITQKDIFVATYGYIKVWGKKYAKLQRKVEIEGVWVNSLALYDAKIFAALGNGDINVYTESSLRLLKVIHADKLPILKLKISDNKLLASSASGRINIIDANTYQEITTLSSNQWDVNAMVIAGSKIYTGSDDYTIRVFDLNTTKLLQTIKAAHSGMINDLLVYKDMLISASSDKTIVVRDIKTTEILRILKGHKKAVNKLMINNGFLISVSSDRSMIFWDVKTGERLKKIKAHAKKIDAIAVNDYNIVTGSRDYKIKIWGYDDSVEALDDGDETKKPKYALLKSLAIKQGIPTSLSQNENNIIITTENGYILFYNKITQDFIKKYTTKDEIVKKRPKDTLSEEEEEEDEREFELKMQKINDSANFANQLLCALEDSTIKVWDLEKNKAVNLLVGSDSAVLDLKISPTNILGGSQGGSIGVYDIESSSFVNLIEGHQYNVNTIALYEDDKVVSAGDDYSIKIRDIESGDIILEIKNAHDAIITKVLVYEDYLISAARDGIIKIRDVTTGKLLKILQGHKAGVSSMVVDEETLISSSLDGTLIAWSMKDFSQLAVMDRAKSEVVDVMITDDYIISIQKDKTIKVWKYYE